jgi:hypothetical protein
MFAPPVIPFWIGRGFDGEPYRNAILPGVDEMRHA